MCNMCIISTSSELDLRQFNSSQVVFSQDMPDVPEEKFLKYEYKWYLGSSDGCSCRFRHLMDVNFPDLGFADPEDWFPEEQEDIDATLQLVKIFKTILSTGVRIDCIDAWANASTAEPLITGNVVVDFAEIPDTSFRFIENYHHELIYRRKD